MSLKIRAVIMKPDHRNDIFIVKKSMLDGKMFKREGRTYEINDSNFQITTDAPWWRLWMFKRYFTTYYYALGKTKPLPVPAFTALYETDAEKLKGFVGPDELAALFNPWFYRTIAAPVKDTMQQLQFYMTAGTLAVVLYIAYQIYKGQQATGA